MSGAPPTWSPDSWRELSIKQQPRYRDADALQAAIAHVRRLPPLVHPGEVDALKLRLAQAARGERFLLQGGDCAERFQDCSQLPIENKLKILLQMSLVLTWGARMPVVRVGRIAGQFAKPRSKDMETIDGVEVPSYRGDHVNSFELDRREPDPNRMVQAHFHAAATLNYVRALLDGGFADLHRPDHWDLGFVRSAARRAEYEDMVARILDALDFLQATGGQGDDAHLRSVELYTSHEGLLLDYEDAQTVRVGDRWYNLGAHMLWIGDRTRQLDGAHIEYFRGISNPIGCKVGPSMETQELVELVRTLNPNNEPGRITLITRYGSLTVADLLPEHVAAVKEAGLDVTWSTDPMHGNTTSTPTGHKTRDFDRVLSEIRQAFAVHELAGTSLGGVHLELTGEDVTECTGGPQELGERDVPRSYETYCDPRLNYAQSLEVAFVIAQRLQGLRPGPG